MATFRPRFNVRALAAQIPIDAGIAVPKQNGAQQAAPTSSAFPDENDLVRVAGVRADYRGSAEARLAATDPGDLMFPKLAHRVLADRLQTIGVSSSQQQTRAGSRSWGVASAPPRGARLLLSGADAHLAGAGGTFC